jgi:hypothetical protein
MSTSGHTKRVTVNAVVLIGYGIGNGVGPFIWQAKYKPRNRVPFTILTACSAAAAVTLYVIRQYLAHQNKKRDEEALAGAGKEDKYDEVYIAVTEDGKTVERKVDRVRSTSVPPSSFLTSDLHTRRLTSFLDYYYFRLSKISRTSRTESSVTLFRRPSRCWGSSHSCWNCVCSPCRFDPCQFMKRIHIVGGKLVHSRSASRCCSTLYQPFLVWLVMADVLL